MRWPLSALPRKVFQDLRASYWFLPSALCLFALALALVTEAVDRAGWSRGIPQLFYATDAQAVRSILAVVAQGALGAAGVMFSMTIVAVSFASSNFGPRLIGNFMQDRGVQVSLGVLLSTFLYALMILRGIRAGEGADFAYVPALGMSVTMGLILLSAGVLIYFVHHIPEIISLENVAAQSGRALLHAIDRLPPPSESAATVAGGQEYDHRHAVHLRVAGYLQAVNTRGLRRLQTRRGWFVELHLTPGCFVAPHNVVATVHASDPLRPRDVARVAACFAVGNGKNEAQNPLFLAEQLTEMLARALSPGVNDPFTAMTCLDWQHAALQALADRGPVDPTPGLVDQPLSFAALLDITHRLPRSYIASDPAVTDHAVRALGRLQQALPQGPRRDMVGEARSALLAHAGAPLGTRTQA